MAIDNIYEGRQLRYMFAEESTFGTPTANGGTFKEALVDHFDVTRDVRTYELPGPHGTRGKLDSDMLMITSGSMANFSTSGPLTIYNVHEFAYAYFQDVTETTGAYFFSNASGSIQPDFTADEGHFITWVQNYRDPASDTAFLAHKYTSCIANSFKVSVEEDGHWLVEINWVAKGAGTTDNDTSSATIVDAEDEANNFGIKDFWDTTSATIDFGAGAQAVILHKFDAEITQVSLKEGPDGAGSFTHYALVDRHMGTFNIEILKDSQAETATSNYAVGTAITVEIYEGSFNAVNHGDQGIKVRGKITGVTYPRDGKVKAVISAELTKLDSTSASFEYRVNNGLTEAW